MRFILSFFLAFLGSNYAKAFQAHPTELLIRGVVTQNLQPQTIKTLITQGADINAVYFDKKMSNFNHFQPIHIAALLGNEPIIKALVENGASLETPIKYPKKYTSNQRYFYENYNAAMLTAQNYKGQNKQFLDFVFAKGVNYKKYKTAKGENLLHAALKTSAPNPLMVQYLLDKGCDPLAEAKLGKNTINLYSYFAFIHNQFDEKLAQQIYNKGLKKVYSIDSLSYLYHCIEYDKLELLKFVMARGLIDLNNEPHPHYLNPLAAAAYLNRPTIFYYLWEKWNYPLASSKIGKEVLQVAQAAANQIYARLLNDNNLSNEELNFLNYANASIFRGIEIRYEPFIDSIFYREDSSIYDKSILKGKKTIYLVGSHLEQYHILIRNKLLPYLTNFNNSDYHFLVLDYTNKAIYKNTFSSFYGYQASNYLLLRIDDKTLAPNNSLQGIYLADENNMVRAKIPYKIFFNNSGDYETLLNYFFKI